MTTLASPVSEAATEKRRRRPPAFPSDVYATAAALFPGSRRTQQSAIYAHGAVVRLVALAQWPDPEWAVISRWLLEEFTFTTVLAELGRIDDEDAFLRALVALRDARPATAKAAAAWLRQRRLGSADRAGSVDELAELLTRTLNRYLVEHPPCEWSTVYEALRAVEWCVAEAEGESP